MKPRPWQIRRQYVDTTDAPHRWDQAYQYLLRWSTCSGQTQRQAEGLPAHGTPGGERR